jgi:signal transduction histidine kinase
VAASLIGLVALSRSEATDRAEFDAVLREESGEATSALLRGATLEAFGQWDHEHALLFMALYDETGAVVEATDRVPLSPTPDQGNGGFFTVDVPGTGEELRAFTTPVTLDDGTDSLVVALPTAPLNDRISSLRFTVVLLVGISIVVLGLSAYLVTGLVLNPVERLRSSAAKLAGGPAGGRLDVPPARDEVQQLAETLNVGLDWIDESMETQRRFLAEASHELRTPIARLRAEIDLALRPGRSHEELVAAVADFDEHAEHLTSLADNFLAKLTPKTPPGTQPHAVTVNQVVANLLHFAAHGDLIQVDVPADVGRAAVVTEPAVLVGVLSNMVGNAFRHGDPPVELTVRRYDEGLTFAVRDCGPGISVEARERVLQPYRRGAAATSGTGLGLSIVHDFATSRAESSSSRLLILVAD